MRGKNDTADCPDRPVLQNLTCENPAAASRAGSRYVTFELHPNSTGAQCHEAHGFVAFW
jgi:hypothetical protein